MFISFEGIDGSGKSTQISLLKERLESDGHKVISLREPGGTELSEKIRELLLHKEYELNSRTELLLFESARAYLTYTIIKPALESGYIVLTDRFYDSTIAYQGYGRGLDLEFINSCNNFAVEGTIPNITFYLKINLNTSNSRRILDTKDRIENSGVEFYERVLNGFNKIAESNKNRFFTIDAESNIDFIHNEIYDIVTKKLNQLDLTHN